MFGNGVETTSQDFSTYLVQMLTAWLLLGSLHCRLGCSEAVHNALQRLRGGSVLPWTYLDKPDIAEQRWRQMKLGSGLGAMELLSMEASSRCYPAIWHKHIQRSQKLFDTNELLHWAEQYK